MSGLPECPLCACNPPRTQLFESVSHTYFRCEYCDLVWLAKESRISPVAERAHYDTHENSPNDPRYRRFLNQLWSPLKQKLQTGMNGLDYGSGPGPTLHLMAQEDGFECAHYDPFFHNKISVLQNHYDFITCTEVAEHFHNPATEFERLHGLLKTGGFLGLMTARIMPEIEFSKWYYRTDPTHTVFYADGSIEYIAREFGFSVPDFVSNTVVILQKLR